MVAWFWRIMTSVTVWHIAASMCYYAVYAGTPLFRDAFALSGLQIGIAIAALTLGYAVFLSPFGIATDRFGERPTLTGGVAALALGILVVAVVPTYWLLLLAVFLLGGCTGVRHQGRTRRFSNRSNRGDSTERSGSNRSDRPGEAPLAPCS